MNQPPDKHRAQRDALSILREYGRGSADAVADIIEHNSDEEIESLVREMIQATAVMATLVASETGTDPKEEIRNEIDDYRAQEGAVPVILDYIEKVLTGKKGTTVGPDTGDVATDIQVETGALYGIIEIGTTLGKRFAQMKGVDFDATMEQVQLLMAEE